MKKKIDPPALIKSIKEAGNEKVQEWKNLMWKFKQLIPLQARREMGVNE